MAVPTSARIQAAPQGTQRAGCVSDSCRKRSPRPRGIHRLPHPGAAATAEPNKWRPLKSRRGRRDLRPPGRRALGHLARLFRARRHGGRSVRDPVSLPRPPRPSPLRLARHGPSGSAEEKSVPGRSAQRQLVTSAPLEARTSALRTWDTSGPRDPQNASLRT